MSILVGLLFLVAVGHYTKKGFETRQRRKDERQRNVYLFLDRRDD
jgi:hypothetical protein